MEIIDRDNGYALLRIGPERGMYGSESAGRRLLEEAVRTGVAMVYSGYWLVTADEGRKDVPVNDCQLGSVREDFDFGALVAVNEGLMRQWEAEVKCSPTLSLRYGQGGRKGLGAEAVRLCGSPQPGGPDRDGGDFYGSSQKNRGVAAAEDPDGCG